MALSAVACARSLTVPRPLSRRSLAHTSTSSYSVARSVHAMQTAAAVCSNDAGGQSVLASVPCARFCWQSLRAPAVRALLLAAASARWCLDRPSQSRSSSAARALARLSRWTPQNTAKTRSKSPVGECRSSLSGTRLLTVPCFPSTDPRAEFARALAILAGLRRSTPNKVAPPPARNRLESTTETFNIAQHARGSRSKTQGRKECGETSLKQ